MVLGSPRASGLEDASAPTAQVGDLLMPLTDGGIQARLHALLQCTGLPRAPLLLRENMKQHQKPYKFIGFSIIMFKSHMFSYGV